MDDSAFVLFIGFGVPWTVIGVVAVIALLKADGQPIRFGKWGLLVAVPILIPLISALLFAAVHHPSSGR
jgi:ATP/ADP translocase